MSVRTNTNPRPLALPPELQDILRRNGMTAQVVASSNGFALVVQGHDSPLLTYPINEKQLKAMTDWGTNSANKKAYNTFVSLVAADFDLPKDFVHARNANGRVAMGLHGYRVGVGDQSYKPNAMPELVRGIAEAQPIAGRSQYGRVPDYGYHGMRPHMMGHGFLGWMPRQQEGWHLRRIGGQLYYPGAPMVAERPDGRMKPGELQSGSYGFYYKGYTTAPVANNDVLADLQTVITPIQTVQPQRPTTPAIPYNQAITSDVYFSAEKWLEVLQSHGIIVDAQNKTLTIQSSAVEADLQYNLTDAEVATLTSNDIKAQPIATRLATLNGVLKDDFADAITMDHLNSTELVNINLHPELVLELQQQIQQQEQQLQQAQQMQDAQVQQEVLPKGVAVIDGNELEYINPAKGWFASPTFGQLKGREGRHGREVTVDNIVVEPSQTEGKYKMTAVIDGEVISHEISKKDYDKFMAVDDFHRMKLFSKIFKEVDMKHRANESNGQARLSHCRVQPMQGVANDRYPVGLGVKITAALCAGAVVTHDILHGPHHAPEIYGGGPAPRVYHKPGVDSPADVAARQFDAMVNNPNIPRGPGLGM